ncbi:hypothetical protein F8568_026950 [Actinomadura sp. LD22]|uniref:Alkaline shock response membrane anchor protein AmaP n=1 Tax=Actinomadura physcomitrii TaxID=2650748 RepID=A0A6I4MCJ6_9ACTN|nr:hypothetical protein [Actinomadura physcomitrii]MWA03958.1 hypothetical protein [Actinomadura physcomitrii]
MRIPIAATGALLLLCGASALALSASGLAGHPPLDPALVRFAAGAPWFLPAAAGVAEILALAGQLWLVLQGRTVVHLRWPDLDPQTRAHARAAADVLVKTAKELPDVQDVRLRLTGTANRPRLVMHVTCAGDALLSEVYGELGAGPVERYRRALGMPDLKAIVRFHLAFPQPEKRPRVPHPETA